MNAQTAIKAETLIGALAKALPELESAKKNKPNPAFKSKYADLAAMIAALEPLREHGLWFRQHSHESEAGVMVETFYIHQNGEQLSAGTIFMPAAKKDAQGFGSALTYARRYALQTAFGLAVEDDDGNAASRVSGRDNAGDSKVSPPGATNDSKASPRAPAPRQVLDGPYTSPTQLRTAIKEFVHSMQGCGDWDEWCGYRDTKEVRELIEQVQRDMPDWWEGWPEQPPEFVPLHRQIELFEANIARQIADIARV